MPAAGFVFLMLACLLALSAAFTAPAASLIARPAAARSESPVRQLPQLWQHYCMCAQLTFSSLRTSPQLLRSQVMGRGDKRTAKGKRKAGSHGISRPDNGELRRRAAARAGAAPPAAEE